MYYESISNIAYTRDRIPLIYDIKWYGAILKTTRVVLLRNVYGSKIDTQKKRKNNVLDAWDSHAS